ncbi:MAG: hypothetical protein C0490_21835, partial [Marivirga sp.]|nr:hypothetical protein [Marivirga sp.]
DFEQHLAYLAKNNFQILSFSEAIKYLKSNEPARKTAVITIDDGYKSFYKNGLPLLKKYGIPATLFINTKTVGGGDYMNWNQLKEVIESDIEIGNHSHSHDFFLNKAESSRYKSFEEEIKLSQSIISEYLKITPHVFSYPYGEFDTRMKDIVVKAGFIAAAAQNSGVIYSESDLFMCPRFPMSETYSPISKFIEKASVKPLKILDVSPNDFIMPEGQKPILELTIDNTDLTIKQLQCFVQGGECQFQIREDRGNKTRVSVQASSPIKNRRRTLYTITVPDKSGAWHWYTHLWINSNVD